MVLLAENAYEDGCLILRRCREHQLVLYQPGSAHDIAGTTDRGSDIGGQAPGGTDDGEGDAAVSIGMETPGNHVS